MSFVGPRPCLPNQIDLIKTRKKYNLFRYLPGITGLSQIKGIDMSNPILLSKTDKKMMRNFSLFKYFLLHSLTLMGSGFGDRVSNFKILMINLNEFTEFNVINNIVFGGAGFLGSHLIDKLLKDGQNVLCIDNLSSRKFK